MRARLRGLRARAAYALPIGESWLRTDPSEVRWPGYGRLDLDGYRVTDRDAGLFDVATRSALLRATDDPTLLRALAAVPGVSPERALDLPAPVHVGYIPPYYGDRDAWRLAMRGLVAIEDTVSGLAAQFVASGDGGHADCLVELLASWARRDALTSFHYSRTDWQAWFALSGTLSAIGLAYLTVRPFVPPGSREAAAIEAWLVRASRLHLAVETDSRTYGRNNHYYRRALHAAAIGIAAGDDDLFRYGVSAVHTALAELGPDGILPREAARGALAVHYQNYAVLHLVPLVALCARQGYPLWELAPAGRTIGDAAAATVGLLGDPGPLQARTGQEQDLSLLQEGRFFGWMEICQARSADARIDAFVEPYRPVWNSTCTGAATLAFYEPPT